MNERLLLYAAVALVVYAAMRGGGSGLFGLPQPVPMAPALDDLGGVSYAGIGPGGLETYRTGSFLQQ